MLTNNVYDNIIKLIKNTKERIMVMARKRKKRTYFVKGDKYSIDDTFAIIAPHLDPDEQYDGVTKRIDFYGDKIKPNSHRYQTFYYKGCTCVSCGLKASYFEKNKRSNDRNYHLNLYGVDENGNEVLFTKDHILPKSKGGENHITNYQPMCEICNKKKLSKMSVKDKIHTTLSKPKSIKKLMVNYYKKHPVYITDKRKENDYETNAACG